MNPPCPYCGDTHRYTDQLHQVRCTNCFNHLDGEPDTPHGQNKAEPAPVPKQPEASARRSRVSA